MPTLRILSGGAAQGLVDALAPALKARTGYDVAGEFGAVGAMADRLRTGTPADILILTAKLIATLADEGHAVAATRRDVGTVETAVAVRFGDEPVNVGSGAALKAALLAADEIYMPDPDKATAGIHFANVLRSLGVWADVEKRIRAFPNGQTAMRALAAASTNRPIGCTQVTEILNTSGVTLVGPLPEGYDLATVYTAAVTARAAAPEAARTLIDLLTAADASDERKRAGFV
ncbi:MAG TPA: substrate-binding domain-containing protein [Microvirga sp.]|nr:substrate-binding domain-containing protein [Microvirga sp.]